MNINVYSIFDTKAKVYQKPFFLMNDDVCIRAVKQAVNDVNTEIHHNPEDFIVFQVGMFDDQTGILEVCAIRSVARCHELMGVD